MPPRTTFAAVCAIVILWHYSDVTFTLSLAEMCNEKLYLR